MSITHLSVKINKKAYTLSMEEARELYDSLAEIFNKPAYYPNTYPVTVDSTPWIVGPTVRYY